VGGRIKPWSPPNYPEQETLPPKKNLGKAVGRNTLAVNENYREFSQFRQVASGLPRSTKYRGVIAGRTNYTSGS